MAPAIASALANSRMSAIPTLPPQAARRLENLDLISGRIAAFFDHLEVG
jgi:hypothetical protein